MSKKILIIEDEQTLVKALEQVLKEQGYKVEVAIDGEEGWQKITSFEPNLILLDLILPKMDGFSVLRKMKENNLTDKIPVVVITNLSDVGDKVLSLGAVDCLIKSDLSVDDIQGVIEKKLK
ncbi:MAG TPA: response regulator [Patescibacteria group bacterium]|nr:response regulator [Patescibacteria group bacterium]